LSLIQRISHLSLEGRSIVPNWYIYRNDQRLGPYPDEQIERISLNNNQLQPGDQIWNPYIKSWETPPATVRYLKQGKSSHYDGAGLNDPANAITSEGSSVTPKNTVKKLVLGALLFLVLFIITSALAGIETALKLIGCLFTGVFIFNLVKTARSFYQWSEIKPRTLYITAMATLLGLFVYLLLLQVGFPESFLLLLILGVFAGLIWGLMTRINIGEGSFYRQGTVWGFIIWGGMVALLQLSNLLLNFSPSLLLSLLALQTGVVTAYNLTLGLRVNKAISLGKTVAH